MSLRKNTIWNLVGSGLPLIAALFCIPYLINHLGKESFGILTLIWALIGYFSLFDMGVGRALTFELSKLNAANNTLEISHKLKAGLLLTFFTGLIGALTLFLAAPYLASNWLKISIPFQHDAMLSFYIAATGVIPTTVTSGLRGALEGLGRFAASNLNKLIIGFCMFILPVISVYFHGNSLWKITVYLVLTRLIIVLLGVIQLKQYFNLKYHNEVYKHIKSLLNYGIWVAITGVIGPLMVYGDRFFVSAAVGAAELPFYAIPQEGLQRLLIIPAALCAALLPQLASLNSLAAVTTYKKNYKRVAILMFVICLIAATFAYPVLYYWLSKEFAEKALPIVLILSVGIWINAMASVPYTLLHANGNPRLTALFHLFELAVYIIALWWLTQEYGMIGAAIDWVGRVTLDLLLLNTAAEKLLISAYGKT